MEYMTAWDVFKHFLAGWLLAGAVLVIISCVLHGDLIGALLLDAARSALQMIVHAVLGLGLPLFLIGWCVWRLIRG